MNKPEIVRSPGTLFKARYGNFIGGQWKEPIGGKYFENTSPVNGRVLCEIARSDAKDIDAALDAAHAAKDAWGRTSATERSLLLFRIAQVMEEKASGTSLQVVGRMILFSIFMALVFYCLVILACAMIMPWRQLIALDLEGIAVSTGSACSSGTLEPSHVLKAMGFSAHRAQNSIRFSLGALTTDADVERVIAVLPGLVDKLRSLTRTPVRV